MKFLLIMFMMMSGKLSAQSDIYSFKIQGANGSLINLADFKGKKIVIIVGSVEVLQQNTSIYVDSVGKKYNNAIVLVIPAADHTVGSAEQKMLAFNKKYPTNLFFSKPVRARKSNGNNQDDFLKWLTHNTRNGHFNGDATAEQTYVISESGILYASLEGKVSAGVFNKLLNQPDINQ